MKVKMCTIDGFLKVMQEEGEIQTLILESQTLNPDSTTHASRKRKRAVSKDVLLRDTFWAGGDGVKLKIHLESKYGVNVGSTAIISKIKDALLLYIAAQLRKEC